MSFPNLPAEYEDPWYTKFVNWATSVQNRITGTETVANAAATKAYADGIKTTADAAFPIKGALGDADLNSVVSAGIYAQTLGSAATLERNYPAAGNTGVLEVFIRSSGELIQRWTVHSGLGAMRGIWIRRAIGGSWTEWNFLPQQRVDATSGRAIYTWDNLNNREQLVYEDTGRRNITAVFPEITSGFAYVSRNAYGVTLTLQDAVLGTSSGTVSLSALPAAFSPAGNEGYVAATGSGAFRRVQMQSNGVLRVFGVVSGDAINGTFYWRTYNARPTSDLGTAAGTIPNA